MEKSSKRETWKAITCVTALAAAITATPALAAEFTWNGATSNAFNESGNWNLTSGSSSEGYPRSGDTAIFSSSATVSVKDSNDNVNVDTIQIESGATLTITGGSDYCIYSSITGEGSLVVSSAKLRGQSGGNVTIDAPVEFTGTCTIKPSMTKNDPGSLVFNKAITGDGAVSLDFAYSQRGEAIFNGDMSGFTGSMTITSKSSDNHRLTSNANNCSLSTWNLYQANKIGNRFPFEDAGTYKFGALKAYFSNSMVSAVNTTLELGTLDKGSYIGGSFPESITANIDWKGTNSILTNDCANIASLTVSNGGTVYFPSAAGIPATLTFSNGGTVLVDNEEVAAAVAEKITGQENVTIKLPSLEVTAGATFAYSLTDNATVAITLANDTKTGDTLLTSTAGNLPTGATYTLLSPNTGSASLFFDAVVSDSTVTAKYKQGVYVWAGAGNGTLATASNWKVADAEGSIETVAGTAPSAAINCVFPADATVSVGKCNSGSILLLGDVTLDSTTQSWGDSYINFGNGSVVEGSGKFITIDNGMPAFRNTGVTATFYSDIEFQSSSFAFWASGVGTYTFYGKLIAASGKTVTLNDAGASKNGTMGIVVAGDMSEFEGTLETAYSYSNSSYLQFTGDATDLSNATVVLGTKGNGTALCGSAGTYTFGSLSGKVKGGSEAVTIVTGSGDAEAKSIAYTPGSADWTLKKKGLQQLTVTGGDFAGYVLDGGTLVTVGEQTIETTITTSVTGKQVVKADDSYMYSLKNRNGFMIIIQ